MTDQINELHGKGSLGKIKQYHKDAEAISTDNHNARSYHDWSIRRSEILAKREKVSKDIAKAKKGSTREKGWRNYLQSKDDSAMYRQHSQDSRNRLSSKEKSIHNTYLKARGVQEDAPVNNVGSGVGVPGAGVTSAGKPANFGDAIVSSGAAKEWKKQNKMFRRKAPMAEEQIDEISRMPRDKRSLKRNEPLSITKRNDPLEQRKGKESTRQQYERDLDRKSTRLNSSH